MRLIMSWRQRWRRLVPRLVPYLSMALLAALVILPLGLFIWLLFGTTIFTVQAITVVDAREHTSQAAREIIEAQLALMPLSRNIFFVQARVLESAVASSLPQVRTVHVQRKLPGTIKTIIQEKTPALLLLSDGQYYFVDEAGIPYEEARLETLPGIVLPTIRNDDSAARVTLGVPVVQREFVAFLQTMQRELPGRVNSEVAQIRIPSLSAREVHVVLGTNWTLKFDVTRDPYRQLDILSQLFTIMSEEERRGLEYVDLRVRNRIYYKTRGAGGSE